jgi:BASS family bile acid:Na+ symporter
MTADPILILLLASVVLTVFTVGLKAAPGGPTLLLRQPGRLLRVVLAMNVIMPAVAVALALAFALHPALKIAVVALAASPVPPLLPGKAMRAGGARAYTIGLLVAVSLLAILFVPLTVELYQRIFDIELEMQASAVAVRVFITVLAPLLAGMLFARFAPNLAGRLIRPVSWLALVLLATGVMPVLVTAWDAMLSLIGNGTVFALVAFVAAGLFAGHRLGGPAPDQRTVLAMAAASRHPGIALSIAHANFPDQKLVAPAILLYLIVNAIIWLPYARWQNRPENVAAGSRQGPMSGEAGRV